MTRIISRTYGDATESDRANYCFIEVTPELAAAITAKRALFDQAHAADSMLEELVFTDYAPEFFDSVDELSEDDESAIADDGWSYAAEITGIGEQCRTEYDRMHVTRTSVYWSATVKHTDEDVESQWFDWSDLADIIAHAGDSK